jgi:hypothetical protein
METLEKVTHGAWRPQRYFTIQKSISKALVLYVSAGLLIQRFGVKIKTIRNGVSRFLQHQSKLWRSYRDRDAVIIDYDSIPANTKTKAKLPIDSTKAYEILKAEYEIQEDINQNTEILHLQRTLEDVYHNRWPAFIKFYTEKISDEPQRILYAKSHALIDAIISSIKEKWPSKIIFEVYQRIIRNEIDALDEPRFSTISPIYFWRVIRNCRRHGIPETLVHDSLGVSREYKVKMTGVIKAFIRQLLSDPKNLLISEIIKRVKAKYDVELSRSSIKSFKADRETRNLVEYYSHGKINSHQNGMPKITRLLAEAPGDQYQGDFYKLQFICLHGDKVIRLWAYMVLDVFSKKFVGWALGEKPDSTLAVKAYKMAFVDHCFLPEEIIVDNDKKYRQSAFKRLIRRTNNLGVIWTKAFPNTPTWKSDIEGGFAVFQKLHSAKDWYIGESVKSKNMEGNPAQEVVKEMWTKKSSMLSKPEMIAAFGTMVEEYNTETNDRKKVSRASDFNASERGKRTIKLEDWMEPLLFWDTITKKRIKSDGRIDLEIDTVKYTYQITKPEILWKYKNSDVRMCYKPEDPTRVFIYERYTLKFISVIEPRMVMTKENKNEIKIRQRNILRAAAKYPRDRYKADEALVAGITRPPVNMDSFDNKILKQQMRKTKFEKEVAEVQIHP